MYTHEVTTVLYLTLLELYDKGSENKLEFKLSYVVCICVASVYCTVKRLNVYRYMVIVYGISYLVCT